MILGVGGLGVGLRLYFVGSWVERFCVVFVGVVGCVGCGVFG